MHLSIRPRGMHVLERRKMEDGGWQAGHGIPLNRLAISATNHCLTGCVIGEIGGMFISTALAVDTLSITIMEAIDNLVVVLVPGAMEADVDDPLIYASIAAGFAVAYPFTLLANRYLIARGKGHALVHEHHHAL